MWVALTLASAAPAPVERPPIFAAPAAASVKRNPEALTVARQIAKAAATDRTLDAMMVQFSPLFAHSVVTELLSNPSYAGSIRNLIDTGKGGQPQLETILAEEFIASVRRRYADINEDVARDYASRFSKDELQKVLGFYAPPVGVKLLAALPDIQAALSAKGREMGVAAGQEADEGVMKRALDEMTGVSTAPKI